MCQCMDGLRNDIQASQGLPVEKCAIAATVMGANRSSTFANDNLPEILQLIRNLTSTLQRKYFSYVVMFVSSTAVKIL
jgi:hypothetical protein